ncbi:MAG: diguanylate cyclase [Campylobacterota bacterium]|nr:diguanylate cyclase [Campylobacterota bacterium]
MKLSIKKIFTTVTTLLTLFILFLAFIALVMLGEHNSQEQISLLQKHRTDIQNIKAIQTEDDTLSNIEFQHLSAELSHNLKKYQETLNAFEPLSFLSSRDDDRQNFDIFKNMTHQFIANTKLYIQDKSVFETTDQFETDYTMLRSMVFDMLSQRINAEHQQFVIREFIIFASVLIGVLFLLMIHKQFSIVLRDIESLYGVTSKENPYEIKTIEVEAISAKFRKDSLSTTSNPAHMDPLTNIKNYKGLIHAYNTTKGIREHNALAICIFEIDNYNLLKRKFDNDFIELIRKKIAFMITLYEQPIDIIASLDESKFVLLLGRASKDESLQECEKIRESIADTFFKVPQGEKVFITVSGGFIIKPSTKSIDASITHTKDILKKAQEKGTNKIAQLRDYAEKF